ncbi:MAG: hypothetical protein ACR2FJ_09345 [Qipengyuania sp.]
MIFTRFASTKRTTSTLALAVALATGGVVATTALAAPAAAQKKKDAEKPAKAAYTEAFIAAYSPAADLMKVQPVDVAAVRALIPAMLAAVESADDKHAAGSLVYSAGQAAQDYALQLQGAELMLESGRVPVENQAQYNFLAGQLAYQTEDFTKARGYIERAVELGYTQNDPQALIAETYFAEDKYADGLTYLGQLIETKRAAGETVSEDWIKRALAIAYNNDLGAQARDFSVLYVTDYPTDTSWGDAIAIALNTNRFEYPEILDLLRLARRTKTFRDSNMYMEYIEAADPRKLPGEVVGIIDEGYAAGMLERTDSYVADARALAAARVKADERDLPALGRDARASGAQLSTVMAAGDAYLSYGRGAEAEEFYTKALGMTGVNTPLVLTRLGIAQLDQGKRAEAEATFNKVEGARQAIANLWRIYSSQQAGG